MEYRMVRAQALSLPEVTEEPHFASASFRVKGKIFITVPPGETHVHFFVSEQERELALAKYPEFAEKLMWDKKVSGLRVALAKAKPAAVAALVRKAWENKAPKSLLVAAGGAE